MRLRRYREQANLSLGLMREVEDAAHKFSRRLFGGLDLVAALGREVGFAVEVARDGETFVFRVTAGPGAGAGVAFGLVEGAAVETDKDLMHEDLSCYTSTRPATRAAYSASQTLPARDPVRSSPSTTTATGGPKAFS